jgi:hypothetical protein
MPLVPKLLFFHIFHFIDHNDTNQSSPSSCGLILCGTILFYLEKLLQVFFCDTHPTRISKMEP